MSRRKVILQRALPALVSAGVLVWLFWRLVPDLAIKLHPRFGTRIANSLGDETVFSM